MATPIFDAIQEFITTFVTTITADPNFPLYLATLFVIFIVWFSVFLLKRT